MNAGPVVKVQSRSAEQKLGIAVNIAILCVCALICAAVVKRFLLPQPQAQTGSMKPPAVGSRVDLAGEHWAGENLVLAVSTTCHFCSASAPFYQRLIPAAYAQGVKVVAVLPQVAEEAKPYLAHLGLPAGYDTVQAQLSSLDVHGTPTLLLVDSRGLVQKAWVGELPPAQEQDVLASLGKAQKPTKAL